MKSRDTVRRIKKKEEDKIETEINRLLDEELDAKMVTLQREKSTDELREENFELINMIMQLQQELRTKRKRKRKKKGEHPIPKELRAKAGQPPISDRDWYQKHLYDPRHEKHRELLIAATDVRPIQQILRDKYGVQYGALERALEIAARRWELVRPDDEEKLREYWKKHYRRFDNLA